MACDQAQGCVTWPRESAMLRDAFNERSYLVSYRLQAYDWPSLGRIPRGYVWPRVPETAPMGFPLPKGEGREDSSSLRGGLVGVGPVG